MKPANYAVIRYIADPARNEPVNVGVVLWNEIGSRLKLDDQAIARVVRDNPHLSRDALLYLDDFLRRRLIADRSLTGSTDIGREIRQRSQFPVVVTEPLFTTVADETEDALDAELDSLLARVVRPPRRRGGPRPGTTSDLTKRWKPWLGTKLVQNHVFASSKTGVPRTVTFFANSGANVALDVLSLAINKADEIQQRADAEAYKAEDILAKNDIRFLVYCSLRRDEQYATVNEAAIRTLQTAGAEVTTTVEETATAVEAAIGVV